MRIHSDTLTFADIYRATTAAGMWDVHVDATRHGSRSRAYAFNVKLSGTSNRTRNSGTYGAEYGDRAATWDEWGMFLMALFDADPNATIPGAYRDRVDFLRVTGYRFRDLQAVDQHRNHRWEMKTAPGIVGSHRRCKCGAMILPSKVA